MPLNTTDRWNGVAQARSTLFILGGVMFAIAAALTVVAMALGTDRLYLHLGEAFIAAGWLVPLIGLLGFYPSLVADHRWLARAAVVFTAVGLIAFTVLGIISIYVFATGGEISDYPLMYIIPGIFSGSLLAFVTVSIASYLAPTYSRRVSLLLLVPSAIFVTNLFILPLVLGSGPNPPEVGLVLTSALTLAMLAIGYTLRTDGDTSHQSRPVAEMAGE